MRVVRACSRRIEAWQGGESFEVANRVRGTPRGYIAMLGVAARPDDGWRHGAAAVMFLVPACHPPDCALPACCAPFTDCEGCSSGRCGCAAFASGEQPSLTFCAAAQGEGKSWKGTAAREENAEQVRLRVDRMEVWIARNRWKQTLSSYFLVPPVGPDRSRRE